MYLNIVPQLHVNNLNSGAELVAISIPELNRIIDSSTISTKSPFPNKGYSVGCNKGRKAMIGFLFHTHENLDHFTTIFTWKLKNIGEITHFIKNIVLDHDHELISQSIMLNIGFSNFKSRISKEYENIAPVNISASLDPYKFDNIPNANKDKVVRFSDSVIINKNDPSFSFISERRDTLKLHSIEIERLEKDIFFPGRYPTLSNVIKI